MALVPAALMPINVITEAKKKYDLVYLKLLHAGLLQVDTPLYEQVHGHQETRTELLTRHITIHQASVLLWVGAGLLKKTATATATAENQLAAENFEGNIRDLARRLANDDGDSDKKKVTLKELAFVCDALREDGKNRAWLEELMVIVVMMIEEGRDGGCETGEKWENVLFRLQLRRCLAGHFDE